VKRGAQQSTDCEHPSEQGIAAWRMRPRFNDRLGDAQDTRDTGTFFRFVLFPGKENEQT
jgi:hypothetical protein